jgi:hypothetical protein
MKVFAMEVDCPYDYVQFGVQGQDPLMKLCPLVPDFISYFLL